MHNGTHRILSLDASDAKHSQYWQDEKFSTPTVMIDFTTEIPSVSSIVFFVVDQLFDSSRLSRYPLLGSSKGMSLLIGPRLAQLAC
jgi:hypothetical protein